MATTSIETLKKEVDNVQLDLSDLKKEADENIKKTKAEAAAEKVKTTKGKINKKLKEFKSLGEETHKADIAKLEALLVMLETSSDEINLLKTEIETEKSEKEPEKEEKGWFKRQRDGATSKEEWKENTWTNVGRVAMGVGAAALAWKGIKWVFGIGKDKEEDDGNEKEEKKSKKKKSSWRKWALGGGALVAIGYGINRLLKGRNLSFEDSIIQAEADLGTVSEKDEINRNRGRITYEESVKQIKSYGLGTTIDKGSSFLRGLFGSKKIEGLDIKFSDYKQLIHAANLVNFVKHKYKGRCLSDTPFNTKSLTGDIYIDIKKGDGKTESEEVISGGMFSTLSNICPDVLNGIFTDTKNKDKFLAYLNKQGIWKEGNIQAPDPKGDKIQAKMNQVRQEIVDTPSEFDPLGNERGQIITTPNDTDKTEYSVQSRSNQETKIKMEVDSQGNILSGKVDGLNIKFTTVEELLRTANLINKLKYQYSIATPLMLGPTDKAFYRTSSFGVVGGHPGIYVDNSKTWTMDDRVIKKETLKSAFPTVLVKKDVFIKYLNDLKDENGKGLWQK